MRCRSIQAQNDHSFTSVSVDLPHNLGVSAQALSWGLPHRNQPTAPGSQPRQTCPNPPNLVAWNLKARRCLVGSEGEKHKSTNTAFVIHPHPLFVLKVASADSRRRLDNNTHALNYSGSPRTRDRRTQTFNKTKTGCSLSNPSSSQLLFVSIGFPGHHTRSFPSLLTLLCSVL